MQYIKLKEFTGCIERHNGIIEWFKDGIYHREDGPACEYADGSKHWWLNGERHRVDGPAVETADGSREWWLNDKCCYIERSDGTKYWFLNGERHRKDGPAIERADGSKAWYLNGEFLFPLSQESQPFIFLEEFMDEGGKELIKVLTKEGIEIWPNLPGLKEMADNWEATKP